MALIVITVSDTASGEVDVALQAEPGINNPPCAEITPAQRCAINMLASLDAKPKEKGLIALIN